MIAALNDVARAAAATAAVSLVLASPLAAGAAGVAWDGFVQSHLARRSHQVDCPPGTACEFPAAELRGQLKAEGKISSGGAGFLGRFDLVHDAAVGDTRLVTREFFGDLTSEKAAARLGRQVVTWGVGDLLFVNDTFPRDWVALFTGQPMQYLKLGSDALKLNLFPGAANLELVIADFRSDNVPTSQRFIFADPLPAGLPRHAAEPGGLEISGRISGYLENWELAGYASRTHHRSPAWRVMSAEIIGTYPRLNTVGASVTGPLGKGVVSLEAGYFDSRQDRDGRDASIENSQFRGLIGYSRQVWEDATVGFQLYGEWMRNYAAYRQSVPTGFPAKDHVRKVATVRFTQLFAHQTVTLSFFAFLGLSEEDRYLIPSLRYAFSDNLWTEVGANLFGGGRNGMFGSMRDNSNVYLTVRYSF